MTRFVVKQAGRSGLLLFCVFLTAMLSFAQATNTGTIVGTVTDPSGAVVPGVTITITDISTGASRSTDTNGSGQYVLVNVAPSIYNVSATKSGFAKAEILRQTVSVGTQVTASFKLVLGAAQQTVQVQEQAVEMQTLNSTVGSTVTPEAIQALPSLGRDATTFATLQPGVGPDGSVAGTVVDQSTFQLDGGNNTNDMDGSQNVYTPTFAGNPTGLTAISSSAGVMPTPADSVEEFKVNTANQTADFNSSAGAQVEIVTKRGRNDWHGTVYEFYLDNNFGGNTWDNNLSGTPIPGYHYNRFGAAGGGPVIAKPILGGETYFFANYEGYRFPDSATYERAVPSDAMKEGILQFNGTSYNLNTLDPRGVGLNPIVSAMWNKYEPEGNDASCGAILGSRCDGVNEIGYKANVSLPESSNFLATRLDHDFGSRWHWMSSYRYYEDTRATNSQVDIGGLLGGSLGTPTALSNRPQRPWYFVTQLTTDISPGFTNDFHYSFLRNYWAWKDSNAPAQITGLGGALEPLGESATGVLAPYNVDTQDIRTRFWDGKDNFFRDDLTLLKGNHLMSFGAQYQHNFDYHQRSDNGGGINYTTTYQLGDSSGAGLVSLSGLTSAGYPTGTTAGRDAAAVLGIVTDSQVAYTRTGANLTLNAPLTPASDKSTIPYYNVYFSDSWHMKPNFTLTYGLSYAIEMPPTEATGKQVALVDAADEQIQTEDYLAQRKAQALEGEAYNPEVGYALVGNVGKGLKYPYNPFYGAFSPRVAAAWNPHVDTDSWLGKLLGGDATVIRGGYGRVYGRLNGVDLVLTPLLGTGLIQPVQCRLALASGACGPTTPTDSTAFRIGVDGDTAPLQAATTTLPQPLYPGYNNTSAAAGEVLDPHFRPNDVDSFDLTIQRRLTSTTMVEVGYIGRLIHHEYQPINLNAVPYMMSAGGQSFEAAYAAIETAMGCATSAAKCGANGTPTVANQPFFETALASSGYCTGYTSCTAAVLANEFSNLQTQSVWSLWSDLDSAGFSFGRTMMNTPIADSTNGSSGQITGGVAENASLGHANYNAGFISITTNNWHGVTARENLTYSKALGTGAFVQATSEYTANDPFNLNAMYGVQGYNRKYIYNQFVVWDLPWYKDQHGLIGRAAGGWTLAPIFTAGSGAPLYCNTQTDAQGWGSGDGVNFYDNEQCVFTSKYTGGNSSHYGITGGTDPYGNSVGTAVAGTGSAAVNMFKNPVAVWQQVRAPILGIDTKNPGLGPIVGLPYWNMDMSISKTVRIAEKATFQFTTVMTNILNHNVFGDTTLALYEPSAWGVLNAQGNVPRKIQLGARFSY
ncbi:carboxypeptidase-like regulatory domain-containing protein [Silvibacterium dinghuense]|uniref:Carboxypeptidase regulatory-like domain-containing protein n=1 Tax=Silvibacterium dinghuense TaxID=1560006 RepID=A0A4Q1SCX1_9BACT|nr:carboxypeptidase-like regulatory domain-containing protein [Silvibacterium dinghuense]RXS94881.1 carboxypeptidase regulatory-like domain-containing protein [Silvibacterium dinghuense]GGH08703.1 hypothetical protein GCM10011586_26360 [Silvibacterium dinghuense]